MRLLLAALVSAAGLAAVQPALAEGGFDPGRAAQSLCSTPAGLKLGSDCVTKVTALLSACKAQASTPDAFKACVQAQLPAPGGDKTNDLDPGRVAQSLCQGPLGAKLGDGCVARLTAIVAGCKGQAGSPDGLKSCVTAQLPALTAPTKPSTAPAKHDTFDPARAAQSFCKSPLGAKLGDGCVARLTALITSCKAKSPAGDSWKSCVLAQLRPAAGDATRKQK
jgi:hypothetical protein